MCDSRSVRHVVTNQLVALAAVFSVLAVPIEAQLQKLSASEERVVGVEVAKPFIGNAGLSFYSSAFRVRGFTPIGERTSFLFDWGFALAGTDFGSDRVIGNPELGIAFLNDEGSGMAFVSVFLPLAKEFGGDDASAFVGVASDFNWFDRFSDEVWSVNAGLTPSSQVGESGLTRFNALITASAVIPRGADDTELFARYAFGLSQDAGTVLLRLDLEGIAVVSESDLSFSERTVHQILVGATRKDGGPGVFLRVPIDDALEGIDAVLGVTFQFR